MGRGGRRALPHGVPVHEKDRPALGGGAIQAHRKVAEEFGERPVIIRTMDVGGDKDLPGVDQPEEDNPFLGWRGIRMCLVPELFKPQLRAILRAAPYGKLRIMFPMVVDNVELRREEILEECREGWRVRGRSTAKSRSGLWSRRRRRRSGPRTSPRRSRSSPSGRTTWCSTRWPPTGQRAPDAPAERGPSGGAGSHREDLRGGAGSGHLGRRLRRIGRRARKPSKLVELGVTELSMSAPSIPRAKKIVSEL